MSAPIPPPSPAGNGQLGAEGFIMGSLYTTFGLAAAGFTVLMPYVKQPTAQRALGYAFLVTMFLAYHAITGNHLWKTGLSTSWYFLGIHD